MTEKLTLEEIEQRRAEIGSEIVRGADRIFRVLVGDDEPTKGEDDG